MAHVPHLYLPRPWTEGRVAIDTDSRRHLERVLRRRSGDPVSYTDGEGVFGEGTYEPGMVTRGAEQRHPNGSGLTIGVAPPASADRARFVVEKLAELGVERLVWLNTAHGEGRPPRREKAEAWAVAALQQSRGAHLMAVDQPLGVDGEWEGTVFAADPAGVPARAAVAIEGPITILVGPEGGFTSGEIGAATRISLGPRILRVETAAVVAAALALAAR